jgi:phosphoglycerate-specific signal transduction histidine kinase
VRVVSFIFLICLTFSAIAQEKQDSADDEYTQVITGRAGKIVDEMEFVDEIVKNKVRDIIVGHYRFLNDAEEARNADVAKIREEFIENKELRDAKIELRKMEQKIKVRDNHFAFLAQLKQLITEEQIDMIKDGLTYNVLNVTYVALCDMIPSLTDEEKNQIMVWLIEAREHAVDGGSSNEKHSWFGKYKGRINNYLSARGYDLQKEREQWEKRLKEQHN